MGKGICTDGLYFLPISFAKELEIYISVFLKLCKAKTGLNALWDGSPLIGCAVS